MLQDLTFADDGNPTLLEEDGISFINFEKNIMNASIISSFRRLQFSAVYSFEPDIGLQNYLVLFNPLDEKEAFAKSLEIEPRDIKK